MILSVTKYYMVRDVVYYIILGLLSGLWVELVLNHSSRAGVIYEEYSGSTVPPNKLRWERDGG